MTKEDVYYIYVIFRPWNGIPCYVGKGKGNRWQWHHFLAKNHPNRHLANIFKIADGSNQEVPIVRIRNNLTHEKARITEIALIKAIGRSDKNEGPLVNMTDGGEGAPGHIPSQKQRSKTSIATKRRMSDPVTYAKHVETMRRVQSDPEVNAKRSASIRANEKNQKQIRAIAQDPKNRAKHSKHMKKLMSDPAVRASRTAGLRTPEALENQRRAMKDPLVQAKLTRFKGRKHTKKTRLKMRISHTGRKHPDETREKIRKSVILTMSNPEFRAKRSALLKGKPKSAKQRQNMSKGQRKRRLREQRQSGRAS